MTQRRSLLDGQDWEAFEAAISAMARFRRIFGRDLQPSFVAELYAAKELGLEVNLAGNEPGHDAVDRLGMRYQVKYRSPETLNVDVNNFDFDYLVLVNLDAEYRLKGMWRITSEQAKAAFIWREKFRKFQATQASLKMIAEPPNLGRPND